MKKTVAWALAAVTLMTFAALPGYGQTVQSVLDKMIDAMGGRKALEAVRDTTITGTAELVQMGMSAPITMYQKEPNKLRIDVEITAVGMTFIQAFDGQKAWWTNPQTMATEEMPDFMTKAFSHQSLGNDSFLNPQKLGITFALKPKATIDGKDYLVLEQTLADGHKITMFIDPATYLPYKSTTKSVDMTGGEVDSEAYVSDYRKVGGLMVAHSLRNLENGAESMRMTITGVSYNANLDDALFIMK
jgi:hypothetical protein